MIKFWCNSILRIDSIYKIHISNSQQNTSLEKITINMCLKSIIDEPKTILYPLLGTRLITNQTPTVCKAKKSIALLKLRKGMLTGTKVTLRKNTAFNFLNMFVFIICPNNKEFKTHKLNNKGCLSIEVKNLFIFPQLTIFYERFPKNITTTINIDLKIKNKQYCSLFYTGLLFLLDKDCSYAYVKVLRTVF
jgi:large subunit ribosomal protein L5